MGIYYSTELRGRQCRTITVAMLHSEAMIITQYEKTLLIDVSKYWYLYSAWNVCKSSLSYPVLFDYIIMLIEEDTAFLKLHTSVLTTTKTNLTEISVTRNM